MALNPDYIIDSVDYINAILKSRGILLSELSQKSKIEEKLLKRILAREKAIDYGCSFLIASALDIEHDIFVNLELTYRIKSIKKE